MSTVKWDIFTGTNFHKVLVFVLEENFAMQKFIIATYIPTYPFLLMYKCIHTYIHYTFMRPEASHEISKNFALDLVKISHFAVSIKYVYVCIAEFKIEENTLVAND